MRMRSVRWTVANPASSNVTAYSPGARNGSTKSPFSDVMAVRTPWRAGDAAVTVHPRDGQILCIDDTARQRAGRIRLGVDCARREQRDRCGDQEGSGSHRISCPFPDNCWKRDCRGGGGPTEGPLLRGSIGPLTRRGPIADGCSSRLRAGVGVLQFGEIDLDHLHHRLHRALGLRGIRIGHQLRQRLRNDLP